MRQISRSVRFVLPLLIIVGAAALFFNKMVFSNLILARGDMFLYFYPYWETASEALQNGRIPLWNPNIFMGAPLLANSQVGFFYPLNWPVWLLFPTPYAINASILLHLCIAGFGAFLAARRVMGVDWSGGLVTAVAFALGGYLTAQIEHINQLQGLAWLPWFLVVLGPVAKPTWRTLARQSIAIAFLFALQLLAGHMQTTFITGVGLGVWLIAQLVEKRFLRSSGAAESGGPAYWIRFAPLIVGAGAAALLAAVQLLPTLELTALSSREGGLAPNEVLSFSLHPLHLARSLLPGYGQSIFSEYATLLPLTLLALACFGAWQWRRRPNVFAALVWSLSGLFLALGVFNPLYWLLARLPGFNLFRVPARWLSLYALGAALLAGVGWQILWAVLNSDKTPKWGVTKKDVQRPLILFLILFILLAGWGFLAGFLAKYMPVGPEAPVEIPSAHTLVGWLLELGLLLGIMVLLLRGRVKKRLLLVFLALIAVSALFLATRTFPYNNLTTPEAYFDLRPPIARLLTEPNNPPGRFLSLSDIFFDPGDLAEIESIYAGQLSPEAFYDYTIAIKHKEIIAPNLPLAYGLSSVDGFDGGILPLRTFSAVMQLVLPAGVTTTDGRLREHLTAVPTPQWLDLFNARYLITDKVGDAWRAGVFYDRQFPVTLNNDKTAVVGYLPPYEATELRLLASAPPGPITMTTAAGATWRLQAEAFEGDVYRAVFPKPAVVAAMSLVACTAATPCEIQALTLVDARDDSFQPLVPGNYRLIHSGDVKIYENLDVQPRAFWVSNWQQQPDNAAVIAAMQAPDFDGRTTAVLLAPPAEQMPQPPAVPIPGAGKIVSYTPETIVVQTQSDQAGLLVLTDANYPGWETAVDGNPTALYQANGLFRAVFVPAGEHEVVFSFRSKGFENGRLITLGTLIGLIAAACFVVIRRRTETT